MIIGKINTFLKTAFVLTTAFLLRKRKRTLTKEVKKLYFGIFVLFCTNLLVGYNYYKTKNDSLYGEYKNPFPYIDVSRSFISQEHFIVNIQPLREKLLAILERYDSDNISIYIESLNSGANFTHNQDVRFNPASLIKMPIAIAAVKKVETGEWAWDSELVLFEIDIDAKSGTLAGSPIGSRYTIRELLSKLLIESDNTAYNILLRNIGTQGVKDYLMSVGLEDLFDKELNVNSKEYTRIFRSLYTSSYLKREYSEHILELLTESSGNLLNRGIPSEIDFAHKYGENITDFTYADSGIVYIPNQPYMITVFYRGHGTETDEQIYEFFTQISKETYEFFKVQ